MTRLIDLNLDAVLWRVMTGEDVSEAVAELDEAEAHRLARACDSLAAACYAAAGPRADVLPPVPEAGS